VREGTRAPNNQRPLGESTVSVRDGNCDRTFVLRLPGSLLALQPFLGKK
jgi:hypothetical protein